MPLDLLLPLALCEAAYSEPPTIQNGDCFVRVTPFNGLTWLAFRGTNPGYMPDVLTDVCAFPCNYPPLGDVHAGFIRNVLRVRGELQRVIGNKPWAATGHSKGGAEAILFGCLMATAAREPEMIVTYGAPRCGFEILNAIRAALPGPDLRNRCDPVPSVSSLFLPSANWDQIGSPDLTLDPIACHMLSDYRTTCESMMA